MKVISLTTADKITLSRIVLVPFLIIALGLYSPQQDYYRWIALTLLAIALFSDFLDGYIARKFHQQSRLGAFLDPLADKYLIVSCLVALSVIQARYHTVYLPGWFVGVIICRELYMVGGIVYVNQRKNDVTIAPTMLGKCVVVLKYGLIVGCLCLWTWPLFVWVVTAILAVLSAAIYTWREFR